MKVLLMSDTPSISTGMGRVHREIGRELKKRGYDVVSIGWFSAYWLKDWTEWKSYRTNNMYYGSDVFDEVVYKESPDIVLTIGDIWMVDYIVDRSRCKSRVLFQWVMYTPIDGEAFGGGVPTSWLPTFRDADAVVAYIEYGKNAILKSLPNLKDRINVVPHGVDLEIYKNVGQEKRLALRKSIGIEDDMVLFLMVVRNQFRKNIPEFCKGWKEFTKNKDKKALFWPHMTFKDSMGWDLREIFEIYGMQKDLVYFKEVADAPTNVDLIPEKRLAEVYNVADVVIMMGGEGFGLPTLEAMACGKTVLAIKHSANIELVEGRGELVEVENYITGSHSTERPVPSIKDLAEKLEVLYSNPKLREEYGKRSEEFAKGLTWGKVGDDWDMLLKRIGSPFSVEVIPERIC